LSPPTSIAGPVSIAISWRWSMVKSVFANITCLWLSPGKGIAPLVTPAKRWLCSLLLGPAILVLPKNSWTWL